MRPRYLVAGFAVLFLALLPFLAARVSGQTSGVPSRISAVVDNTKLAVLRGNTHPMARAEFDRGPAPASLPMEHMMLVLKRSAQQETALETLLAQQQDRTSANYHKWLSPEQFGQQFGPSDQDMQTITSWLQSNGFQVNSVAAGRTTIDFSGTAGQVQAAFHTAIHSYVLTNGEQHWANSSDPQIPTALTPVVAGVGSLNNFRRKPLHSSPAVVRKNLATGKFTRISPQVTFPGQPYGLCNGQSGTTNCWGVGPGDFATIYNVPSTATGAGQTIAIVSDSDIYAADVTAFRSIFSLPAATIATNNSPACPASAPCFDEIEATTTDPGVQGPKSTSQDEVEAVLDVEWAGAVAPEATIDLVVAPTTNSAFGGDTAAAYIINCPTTSAACPVAVPASVLSYSYGDCELQLGTTLNQMYNTMWQQAAADGITVVVATGDSAAAGCDNPNANEPAQYGLAVTGEASTPYDVAVGGTDFNDLNNPTTYWSNIGTTTGQRHIATAHTTASALVRPFDRQGSVIGWATRSAIWLGAAFFLMILGLGLRRRLFGWSVAGPVLALSLVAVMAACGGGSSTSTSTTSSSSSTAFTSEITSAKGYIPETTYNDSCTNSIIYVALGNFSSAESACNNATVQNDGFLAPAGGGGGVSSCTTPTGPSPANCAGGYPKPSWQVGTNVPNDGKRDIPDVSLFAGDGTIQNFYIVCEADEDLGSAPCSLSAGPTEVTGNYYIDFVQEGGTSVSAQAFAGVVALIDQKMGGKQGNINPMLYALASGPSASSIFHDVTFGTNAVPCIVISGTPGCSVASGYTVGVLSGYNAGAGFDLATGLGSVNVGNLISNFP